MALDLTIGGFQKLETIYFHSPMAPCQIGRDQNKYIITEFCYRLYYRLHKLSLFFWFILVSAGLVTSKLRHHYMYRILNNVVQLHETSSLAMAPVIKFGKYNYVLYSTLVIKLLQRTNVICELSRVVLKRNFSMSQVLILTNGIFTRSYSKVF